MELPNRIISICRNGAKIGDWNEEDVKRFYEAGSLIATDYYWTVGMTEWAALSSLLGAQPHPMPQTHAQTSSSVQSPFWKRQLWEIGKAPGSLLALFGGGMLYELYQRCPRRESNPHGDFSPQDFKSCMSAIPSLGLMLICNSL